MQSRETVRRNATRTDDGRIAFQASDQMVNSEQGQRCKRRFRAGSRRPARKPACAAGSSVLDDHNAMMMPMMPMMMVNDHHVIGQSGHSRAE
jgi:hypothetical protein